MESSIFVVKNGRTPGKPQKGRKGVNQQRLFCAQVGVNGFKFKPWNVQVPSFGINNLLNMRYFPCLIFRQVETRDTFNISNIHFINRSLSNQYHYVPEVRTSYRPDIPFCFLSNIISGVLPEHSIFSRKIRNLLIRTSFTCTSPVKGWISDR